MRESSDLIVRLAPLISGQFRERRRQVHRCLILAALSEMGSETFSLEDIKMAVKNLMKMDVDTSVIVSILTDFENEGIVENIGAEYIIKKMPKLPTIETVIEPIWKDFVHYLENRKVEVDQYIDKDIRKFFEHALIRLYLKFVEMMNIDRDQIEVPPIERNDLLQLAKSLEVPLKFVDYFLDYIDTSPKILLDSVYRIYGGLINIELIFRERIKELGRSIS